MSSDQDRVAVPTNGRRPRWRRGDNRRADPRRNRPRARPADRPPAAPRTRSRRPPRRRRLARRVTAYRFLVNGEPTEVDVPGMLVAARAYLDSGGGPDEDAIREAIAGNLCRCTGYTKIVEAIAIAAGGHR